jgi:hypothetical protein
MGLKIAIKTGDNIKKISETDISFYKIVKTDNLWRAFITVATKYFRADYESGAFIKTCFTEEYINDNAKEIFESFGDSFAVVFTENRYYIFVISRNRAVKIIPGEYMVYTALASVFKSQYSILLKTPSS